jgi:hypothetical protein
LDLLRQ